MVYEVDGKQPQTFKVGEAYVEMPGEVHNFRNASSTAPAKALGFQYANKGQPLQTNPPKRTGESRRTVSGGCSCIEVSPDLTWRSYRCLSP